MAASRLDRRTIIKAAGASVVGMAILPQAVDGAPKAKSFGRIDVQFHFVPDFYRDLLRANHQHVVDRWSVNAALDYMDKTDIRAAVLSVSSPGVDFLAAADSVALARKLNEASASVIHDHPSRFGGLAVLPLQDPDAALREVEYALDQLKLDGVCVLSNVKGHYLGSSLYAPLFDEFNRRKIPVYVHPTDPPYAGSLEIAEVATEWPFDTARAAADLIFSGTIRRCPDMSVILAHAGGALAGVARRMEETAPGFSKTVPKVSLEEAVAAVRSFYYDLAVAAHDNILGALRGMTTMDHVLFASDWPFAPDQAIRWNVEGFESLHLTRSERYAVERGNAERLFPRLKQALK